MRYLDHPGPAQEPRQLSEQATASRDLLVRLPPKADLMEGLVAALSARELTQAGVILLSGTLAAVSFMTGRPDTSGRRAATHAGPWALHGPLTLLGGSAIVGLGADDRPLVHCHAIFADPDGAVRGGHMLAGECPLDEPGLAALACCPVEAGFKIAYDRETNFPIFHPLAHRPEEASP